MRCILMMLSSTEDHVDRVRNLFDRLRDAHLTVNLAKCEFAKATVTYLGKVVRQGQVRPVQAKVTAVEQYPVPSTKKELMLFWVWRVTIAVFAGTFQLWLLL